MTQDAKYLMLNVYPDMMISHDQRQRQAIAELGRAASGLQLDDTSSAYLNDPAGDVVTASVKN